MKITNTTEFGKIVKERRKQLGYTQAYISEFSGLSMSFISDLENGKKTIEMEKAIHLASLLGIDIEMRLR